MHVFFNRDRHTEMRARFHKDFLQYSKECDIPTTRQGTKQAEQQQTKHFLLLQGLQ